MSDSEEEDDRLLEFYGHTTLKAGNVREMHECVTTRILDFSNELIHLPGNEMNTEYSKELRFCCGLKVFANGWQKADEGYVSVMFYSENPETFRRGYCNISVIDAIESQRFCRSFEFDAMERKADNCIQYITRKQLLSEPDEFLPHDILTLRIEVHFEVCEEIFDRECCPTRIIENIFDIETEEDGTIRSITFHLDFPVITNRLAEESSYFRAILSNPMKEQITKTMSIPKDELESFKLIVLIMIEESCLDFGLIKEIFDLYIVAHKYDIPLVTELCTCFLKLSLSNHTTNEYFEIADKYEDEALKDMILELIFQVKNTDCEKEMVKEKDRIRMIKPFRKNIWFYDFTDSDILTFEMLRDSPSQEDPTFDFHK